jgi:hypothetical protein
MRQLIDGLEAATRNAHRAFTAPSMRGAREGRRLAAGWFASLVVEYKRAIAAEQRYHALKRGRPPTVASSGVAIPRRIFEELYDSAAGGSAGSKPPAARSERQQQRGPRQSATPGSASGNGG